MARAAIIKATDASAALIDEMGGSEALGYETNPRATAVASLFVAKVLGAGAADVPLEELVTPPQLRPCLELFGNPKRLDELRRELKGMDLVAPRVWPQPDGSVIVLLAHTPLEGADEIGGVTTPQNVPDIEIRLRLVAEPDDWRVSRIGD